MFDLTNKDSFRNVENWLEYVKKYERPAFDKMFMILIGNKSDMKEER